MAGRSAFTPSYAGKVNVEVPCRWRGVRERRCVITAFGAISGGGVSVITCEKGSETPFFWRLRRLNVRLWGTSAHHSLLANT